MVVPLCLVHDNQAVESSAVRSFELVGQAQMRFTTSESPDMQWFQCSIGEFVSVVSI
jgi:hypothetical protein